MPRSERPQAGALRALKGVVIAHLLPPRGSAIRQANVASQCQVAKRAIHCIGTVAFGQQLAAPRLTAMTVATHQPNRDISTDIPTRLIALLDHGIKRIAAMRALDHRAACTPEVGRRKLADKIIS